MSQQDKHLYEFGPYRLDTAEQQLLCDGQPVPLPPKAFETLVVLVKRSGHLVEKDELMKSVWPDSFVEESNLSLNIHTLRKALGEGASGQRFIETVPKRGYRFVAGVHELTRSGAQLVFEKHTISRIVTEEDIDTGADDEAIDVQATTASPTLISGETQSTWLKSRRAIMAAVVVVIALVAVVLALQWRLSRTQRSMPGELTVSSIAVLPFKSIGVAGNEDEYLKMGMSDALTTRLSNARGVIVRPTSAVLRYTRDDQDPVAAGRELGVEAVLDGKIQRVGERVRVTVQLVRVNDGASLWAAKFDESFTDILAVEDSISAQVARALALRLSGEQKELLEKRYTNDSEAHKLYLKGRFFWNKRTPEALLKSIEYFIQAKDKDPEYALAYVGLSDAYQLLGEYNALLPNEAFSKARVAATKALEIDKNLAEAHNSLAYTLAFYDWDWAGAENEFKRALDLNPNYATAHQWYGEFLTASGRYQEALSESKRAEELDPLSLIISANIEAFYYMTRRYDEAIAQAQKIIELDPNFPSAYLFLWISYEQKGMTAEAVEALFKCDTLFGDRPEDLAARREAYLKGGTDALWRKGLEHATEPARMRNYIDYQRAMLAVRVGDKDQTFYWLEKSRAAREKWFVYLKMDPQWDSIRTDPRFAELVRSTGLTP